MNHIVIIGFMGSGKTRVGKALSQELKLPFLDVDKAIVKKMGMPLKDIFQKFGEPFYRALETMQLKDLLQDQERKVVSLGSGLPMQEQNQGLLPKLGTVVYLKGSLDVLKKRLEGNSNPLLEGENQEEKIKKLLKQRDPVYAGFADITEITGDKSFEALIQELKEKLSAFEPENQKNS